MRLSKMNLAAEIFVTKHPKSEPYFDGKFHEYGFIVIKPLINGEVFSSGAVSMDIFGAECNNHIEEAEKYILTRINSLRNEQLI